MKFSCFWFWYFKILRELKNRVKRIVLQKLILSLHMYLKAFFAYCKIQKRAEVRSFPYCYLYYIGKRPTSWYSIKVQIRASYTTWTKCFVLQKQSVHHYELISYPYFARDKIWMSSVLYSTSSFTDGLQIKHLQTICKGHHW